MDFFNEIMKFGDIFESQETIDELKDISDEIKKYDVYDVLARISGLNLMPHNQNKSVLLDSLIAGIICEEENTYNSTYKMSAGKFKKLIGKINETNLTLSIDPNENAFYQNVMLMDNYTVFNGIDNTPAYNLQMLIDILFNYENDFPKEYNQKIGRLMMLILGLSEEIARKISIKECEIVSDEGKYVVIPDSEKVKEYAECVVFDEQRIQLFLKDYSDLLEEIIMPFGSGNVGSMNNRPFYSKPFVRNCRDNTIILLNVSLLPNFLFFQALKIASEFGIKDKVINRYNNYVWRDCRKSLEALGHHKIKESMLGIELINNAYYKECIVNVYNNQLMLTVFVCDDACDYSERTMHSEYPDEKHTLLFEKRMKYFFEKMQENAIARNDIYCLLIISGFGRGMGLRVAKNLSKYKSLQLNDIEAPIILGDTLSNIGKSMHDYDLVLTNPPFGTKKGGERATRDDFTYPTSNKQLNFLQHIYRSLKNNGKARAAVVLPDNVLFADGDGEKIRMDLLDKCNLHTILRLPTGIFYAQGVKTNVLFFTRGKTDKGNTKEVWIYDLRNDMPSFGKTNPLKPEHFDEFIECYADGNLSRRKETYSEENPNGRWRKFSIQDILARDKTSLDITWMKTESDTDNYTLAELLDQIKEKSQNIAKAVSELEQLIGEVEE